MGSSARASSRAGLRPVFGSALGAFALAGVGNGLILVYERLLIQTSVPDQVMARVFGAKDGLTAWAFAIAFVVAGGLIEALGVRTVLVVSGLGGLLVWAASSLALRRAWVDTPVPGPGTDGNGAVPSPRRQRSVEPERQRGRLGLRRWS